MTVQEMQAKVEQLTANRDAQVAKLAGEGP
jgi:hypothetical protein